MITMFEPLLCPSNKQRELNKFYKKHRQNVSCNRQDQVYITTTEQNEIIAGVIIRYLPKSQIWLLRSLFVAPEYRNKGVAKQLCQLATDNQEMTIFTLFEPRLINFYTSIGFTAVNELCCTEPQIEKQIKKGLLLMSKPSINNEC